MPIIEVLGQRVEVGDEFLRMSPEEKGKAVDDIARIINPPPAGAMIHEAGRSYIAGRPDLSVDTKGMAPGMASPELRGVSPDLAGTGPDRNTAAAALQLRANGNVPGSDVFPRVERPALQGATFSLGDEAISAGAAAREWLKGRDLADSYRVAQEAQRQDLTAEREEHPYRSTALQVGGALANAPALASMGPLGPAAAGASPALRATQGAIGGGILGAGEGFASGSGIEDRTTSAAKGGLLGAIFGAAAPLVADRVGALYRNVADRFTVDRQLANSGLDVGREAAGQVGRVLQADRALEPGSRGYQRIIDAGPEGMMVDAGKRSRGLLDYVAQGGASASEVAEEATRRRGDIASNVLTGSLDRSMGPPVGVATAANVIREGGRQQRHQIWEDAYNSAIDYSAPAARQLETDLAAVPGKVVAKARELMQIERVPPSQQLRFTLNDDGTYALDRLPDVRQIDYIARGLRHVAETGEDAGALGGRTQFSSAYGRLASDIRQTLGDLVPSYRAALNHSADEISWVQANRLGSEALRPNYGRDELRLAMQGMTAPERQAVGQGIRASIDDAMANVKGAASSTDPQVAREAYRVLNQLNSRAVQDKLTTVLGANEAGRLYQDITRATRAAELAAGMAENSKTFGRMAGQQAEGALSSPGMIERMKRGEPLEAAKAIPQWMFGRRPEDLLAMSDETKRQVASLLTRPDPLAAMQTLLQATNAGDANRRLAELLGRSTGTALGVGGYTGYQRR